MNDPQSKLAHEFGEELDLLIFKYLGRLSPIYLIANLEARKLMTFEVTRESGDGWEEKEVWISKGGAP